MTTMIYTQVLNRGHARLAGPAAESDVARKQGD